MIKKELLNNTLTKSNVYSITIGQNIGAMGTWYITGYYTSSFGSLNPSDYNGIKINHIFSSSTVSNSYSWFTLNTSSLSGLPATITITRLDNNTTYTFSNPSYQSSYGMVWECSNALIFATNEKGKVIDLLIE